MTSFANSPGASWAGPPLQDRIASAWELEEFSYDWIPSSASGAGHTAPALPARWTSPWPTPQVERADLQSAFEAMKALQGRRCLSLSLHHRRRRHVSGGLPAPVLRTTLTVSAPRQAGALLRTATGNYTSRPRRPWPWLIWPAVCFRQAPGGGHRLSAEALKPLSSLNLGAIAVTRTKY
ncbi:MAG: hypothetical protein ACLU9S_11690, partial [Oscillospiraceae bacterium]